MAPGTELHYELGGRAAGDAVVLIHPLGGDLRSWDEVRTAWRGRYRVLAYDVSGAGGSPVPPDPPAPAQRVAELEVLRARFGFDRVVPIGVAIGAMIAALYAAAHPERTAALVLCNPALALSPAGREMTLARVARVRTCGMAALIPEAIDLAFNGLPRNARYSAYLARFRDQDPRGFEMSALAALAIDLRSVLPRIACPTLVIAGRMDILFPPAEARRVAALLPRAEFRELPDAAHFPPVQAPETFAAAVDEFLSRVRGDAQP